jgi:CheY-like chemotaxis protein
VIAAPAATRRARVLVVEDEAIIAWQLEIMLEDLGYAVAGIASDAPDAVRLALETRPDAILMDVRLGPGQDGVAAAREILARQAVPIVFCTAFADDAGTAARIRALGGSIIAKPVDAAVLQAALGRALA